MKKRFLLILIIFVKFNIIYAANNYFRQIDYYKIYLESIARVDSLCAEIFLNLGNYEDALYNLLNSYKNKDSYNFKIGYCYYRLSKWDEAYSYFVKIKENSDYYIESLDYIAKMYFFQGKFSDGFNFFKPLAQKNKEDYNIQSWYLDFAYYSEQNKEEIKKNINNVKSIIFDKLKIEDNQEVRSNFEEKLLDLSKYAFDIKEYKLVFEIMDYLVKIKNNNNQNYYLTYIEYCINSKNYKKGLKIVNEALKLYPDTYEFLNKEFFLLRIIDKEKAIKDIKEKINKNPNSSKYLEVYAEYIKSINKEEYIKIMNRILTIKPWNIKSYWDIFEFYNKDFIATNDSLKKIELANNMINVLEKLLKILPDYDENNENLDISYYLIYQDAINILYRLYSVTEKKVSYNFAKKYFGMLNGKNSLIYLDYLFNNKLTYEEFSELLIKYINNYQPLLLDGEDNNYAFLVNNIEINKDPEIRKNVEENINKFYENNHFSVYSIILKMKIAKLNNNDELYKKLANIYERMDIYNKYQYSEITSFFYDKDKDICERFYKIMLRNEPDNVIIKNNLAYLYSEKKENLDFALKLSLETIKADSTSVVFLDTLGWIFYVRNELLKSKETYDKCISYALLDMKNKEKNITEEEIKQVYYVLFEHYLEVLDKLSDNLGKEKFLGELKKLNINWKKSNE